MIRIGDTVLLRQKKHTKFSTKFDPRPFQVACKKGTMITAARSGKYVTRNASMFKKVNLGPCQREEEDSDDGDDDDRAENRSQNNDCTEDLTRRYPVRNRKPLQQYGQNVYES